MEENNKFINLCGDNAPGLGQLVASNFPFAKAERDYEEQYLCVLRNMINDFDNGKLHFKNTRTKFKAIKKFGVNFEIDLKYGKLPILTTKEMKWKTAVKENMWIYVKGSNNVNDLNAKIWDEWADSDGSIGKAYGYQARHLYDHNKNKEIDQVQILLDKLQNNREDRGMIVNLWNVEDLSYMNLRPCAFMTIWDVEDDYLNCTLVQRSGDAPVGVPHNTLQYAILVQMFAHVSGLRPGRLHHYINNFHIYENQLDGVREQLGRKLISSSHPHLVISKDIKKWDDFKAKHLEIIDYNHHPYIDMGEIAV